MSKRPADDPAEGPSAAKPRLLMPSSLTPLGQRMSKLLWDEQCSDVHFNVGDPRKCLAQRIPAIVAVLCTASEVFKAQLSGSSDRPKEVNVPDADPEAFKVVLRCWALIDTKTTDVMNSDAFLAVSPGNLKQIVVRDSLCVDEMELFERVLKWARKRLEAKGEEETSTGLRTVLGEVLHEVRFPLMPAHDFRHTVAKSGILTPEEAYDVFMWHLSGEKPTRFSTEPRRPLSGRLSTKVKIDHTTTGIFRRVAPVQRESTHFSTEPRRPLSGRISMMFKIDHTTTGFFRRVAPVRRESSPVRIGAYQWSIRAARIAEHGHISVQFYVTCLGSADAPNTDAPKTDRWGCDASVTLRIAKRTHSRNATDIVRSFDHRFTPFVPEFGYADFVSQYWDLLAPNNPYRGEDGDVVLIADIRTKPQQPPAGSATSK